MVHNFFMSEINPPSVLPALELSILVKAIKKHIAPEIVGATDYALSAYEIDEENNRPNASYLVGANLWGNLNGRLGKIDWLRMTSLEDGCRITIPVYNKHIQLNILKVHPETRIPLGGKSLKKRLSRDHQVVLPFIYATLPAHYELNIGYDVSLAAGLGKITLDRIYGSGKNSIAVQESLIYDYGAIDLMQQVVVEERVLMPQTTYVPRIVRKQKDERSD